MNLSRAYLLLAAFYSLLILVGVIAVLAGGGPPLALVHLVVGALAVTGLWGYVLKRGFLNPRLWRPLAAVLGIGAVVQLYLVLTLHLSGVLTSWMLTSTIFSLLLIMILYRYGDRDQPHWASPEERESGRQLDDWLAAGEPLVAEKREDGREASVKVVKAGSEYRASVTRRNDGDEERFEERFRCPATLAFFLEKFADVSVSDFRRPDNGTA